MANRLAVSLALPDTDVCLKTLRELAPRIGMAEIRLDLMKSYELERLINEAPCRLIITCRPPREGGQFKGSEAERLDILRQAIDLRCAFVDVEWDSVAALRRPRHTATQLIVSRHWLNDMPSTLLPIYKGLRLHADVVKLVGRANNLSEILPVLSFLRQSTSPVIGLAMGEAGQLTRLLAPCFGQCLLTYAALTSATATAAGQLTIDEMSQLYHLNDVGPHTAIHLHLCANTASAEQVAHRNSAARPGEVLHLPVVISQPQVSALVTGLQACLPRLTITADAALAATL
jgi:3-dehydroquinate dehydratase/shikimate dehydrogenase